MFAVAVFTVAMLSFAKEVPKPFIHWTFDDANAVTNCGIGGAEYTPIIDGNAITYTNGVINGALYIDTTKNNETTSSDRGSS